MVTMVCTAGLTSDTEYSCIHALLVCKNFASCWHDTSLSHFFCALGSWSPILSELLCQPRLRAAAVFHSLLSTFP